MFRSDRLAKDGQLMLGNERRLLRRPSGNAALSGDRSILLLKRAVSRRIAAEAAETLGDKLLCLNQGREMNAPRTFATKGDMVTSSETPRLRIFLDADACPVKEETYRVAARYKLKVYVVANSPILVPRAPGLERVVVGTGPDVADDWIVEHAGRGAIVVTSDVPLASRCVKNGAEALAPTGKPFSESSIGMALATRDLMDQLRSAGQTTGGPPPFGPRDRSRFLGALDNVVARLKRSGIEPAPL